MANLESVSIGQLIALFVINATGIGCFSLIFFLMKQKSRTPKTKLFISIGLGLISIGLLGVVLGNLGIYLWLESGDFQATSESLPIFICLIPIVFLMATAGSYIQLIYRDKMQVYIDSSSNKKS